MTFKVGDEVYMCDMVIRKCQVVDNLATGDLDVMPLDPEYKDEWCRITAKTQKEAIDAMIEHLEDMKEWE